MGKVHYVAEPYWPHNTCLYVTDFLGNNPRFIYHLLQTINFTDYNSGSVQPSLNPNFIYNIPVKVPPRTYQDRIAEIAQVMDKRLELIVSTNTTLESIAHAIFKSWFIDFDPVHAKAAGQKPEGMDAETAALFPSEFEESELGLIPKGWRVGSLRDILHLRVNRTKPSNDTSTLPYVPIECISSKSVFLQNSLPGEKAKSSLTLFQTGDVLFGAMRPYFHKVCFAPFDGVTRTTVLVLKPVRCYREFGLFAMFDDSTIEYAVNNSEGSTIPYVKWRGALENKTVVIPPENISLAFSSAVEPILRRGILNCDHIQTLTALRDTLLPRLISGKLRIPEAEELVEEAVS